MRFHHYFVFVFGTVVPATVSAQQLRSVSSSSTIVENNNSNYDFQQDIGDYNDEEDNIPDNVEWEKEDAYDNYNFNDNNNNEDFSSRQQEDIILNEVKEEMNIKLNALKQKEKIQLDTIEKKMNIEMEALNKEEDGINSRSGGGTTTDDQNDQQVDIRGSSNKCKDNDFKKRFFVKYTGNTCKRNDGKYDVEGTVVFQDGGKTAPIDEIVAGDGKDHYGPTIKNKYSYWRTKVIVTEKGNDFNVEICVRKKKRGKKWICWKF